MNPSLPSTQCAVQLIGPDQLTLNCRKPVPRPGPHEILCRVDVVGLCFSDMKLLQQFSRHVRKAPVISGAPEGVLDSLAAYVPGDRPTVPGHEPVVTIVAVGNKVQRFQPGERHFIQADWRWLKTAGSNGAFGYNFEGALQEYVVLDERLVISPEGECMLLPAPIGTRSASAFGLVEPWACVECSYRTPERQTLLGGARRLIWTDVTPGPELAAFLGAQPAAKSTDWTGAAAASPAVAGARRVEPDTLEPEAYDDVLYLGAISASVERIFPACRNGALILIAQCGQVFGAPVQTALGALHYRGLRMAGTAGQDPAQAAVTIPECGDIRRGDRIHVIGAGGPMGVMHVIRNLCEGVPDIELTAADLSDERLAALAHLAEPAAKQAGVKYQGYNSSAGSRPGPWSYTVVMAPVPALVASAVRDSGPGAIINIFAGIPVDKGGPVDLDAYCRNGMYFIGTSGSRMDDMRAVLRKVEDGRLNTNVSVAAVAGLDGAIDGMRAVKNQEVPGKILIYPACRGMPLTRLEDLSRIAPEVSALLSDGVWTLEAENALRARYAEG
ncbi:MAG: alcohol dehydrogenase catalytic domain-containing protein [Kiritimatiellae bacterium]|nr:alcohol dehydrogenase catalytic domain-containing protein [Kiritimatiellia bacterium]